MTITPQDRINGSSKKPEQKITEVKSVSPTSAANAACPFIGLGDDPSTRLLFASPSACCHRAEPVDAVDLEHQQAYCLTAVYKVCPVFKRPEWGPLPTELKYQEPARPASKKRWLWLVLALILLGLMAGAFFIWGNGGFGVIVEPEPEAQVPAVIVPPTKTPTLTPTVVSSPTSAATKTAVASATPNPTNTNTPLPSATAPPVPSATLVPTFTPVLPTETAVPLPQAEVIVPFLNVRSGPGVAYDLLATVSEGEQYELTGRVSDGTWWLICCVNGEQGWVIAEAVEIPEGAEAIVPRAARIPASPTPTGQP